MAVMIDDLKNIIESLIFVSDGPLTVDQIKTVLPEADPKLIRMTIDGLIQEYEKNPRGFHLREIAEGIQFRSRPEYKAYVTTLLRSRPPRLSKAALETLSIIAYKQPIIRADIEHIRGVDSGGVLRLLMERKLVRVLGRREIPGRPLIYATTKKFLEVFELKNLKALPTPKEIEALGANGAETYGNSPETVTVIQSAQGTSGSEKSENVTRKDSDPSLAQAEVALKQNEDVSHPPLPSKQDSGAGPKSAS